MLFTNTYPLFLRLMNNFREDETLAQNLQASLEELNGPFFENLFQQGSSVVRKAFENSKRHSYGSLVQSIETIYLEGHKKILDCERFGQVILEEVYYKNYYYSFLINNTAPEKIIILTNFYNEEEKKYEHPLLTGTPVKPFTSMNKGNWISHDNYIFINIYNAFFTYGSCRRLEINSELNIPFFNDVIADFVLLPQNYDRSVFCYTAFKNIIVVHDFDMINWHRKLLSTSTSFPDTELPFD